MERDPAPDAPRLVIVGRVRRAHGVHGTLVVESLTSRPDEVFAAGRRIFGGTIAGDAGRSPAVLHVAWAEPFQQGLRVQFDEVAGRDAADSWRDRFLLVPADELPPPHEDEIYLHDLIGLRAELAAGDPLGSVEAFYELPQGIMLEVRPVKGGDTVLIPYRDEFVRSVDVAGGRIVIDPPAGFFE
jgi:16S rRNA processing protein RimM